MSVKCEILSVKFDNLSRKSALNVVLGFLKGDKKRRIYTPNPEMVMLAQKDNEFMEVLNSADLCVPDGIGIVIGSKFTGEPIKERVAGYDLIQSVFDSIKSTDITVYFLGGAPGIAEKAKEEMEKKHSGLKIVGTHDGYFNADNEQEVIDEINALSPDLLLVGIGFPRQEKWIYNNIDRLSSKVLVGVGGSFDVMSGQLKRAPEIFIRLGLEWFYRLITQPSRFVRMLQLPLFLIKVILKGKNKK